MQYIYIIIINTFTINTAMWTTVWSVGKSPIFLKPILQLKVPIFWFMLL